MMILYAPRQSTVAKAVFRMIKEDTLARGSGVMLPSQRACSLTTTSTQTRIDLHPDRPQLSAAAVVRAAESSRDQIDPLPHPADNSRAPIRWN